jgi:hypothetical protein
MFIRLFLRKKRGTSSPKNADHYCFNHGNILLCIDRMVKLIVFNIVLGVLKRMDDFEY